jgi:hypothetical protein
MKYVLTIQSRIHLALSFGDTLWAVSHLLLIGNRVVEFEVCAVRAVWIVRAFIHFLYSFHSVSTFLIYCAWSCFKAHLASG